jgi:hypothetical protein
MSQPSSEGPRDDRVPAGKWELAAMEHVGGCCCLKGAHLKFGCLFACAREKVYGEVCAAVF